MDKTVQQVEEDYVNRIEELSYMINGLENYQPFEKALDRFRRTVKNIDDNWHFVFDPAKLHEIRVSKFASSSILSFVDDLKGELEKIQKELIILRNPDLVVNKDYDPN